MTMSSVTVRVDSDTKQKASDIAEDFGFDLSSVTRAFDPAESSGKSAFH